MSETKRVIITFYSYKGGVGRSMALANVAWLLSNKYGKKVLAVDWDLEAPGLHRFFGIKENDIKFGLIDLFDDYKNLLKGNAESLPQKLVDINKCLINVPLPTGSNAKGSLSIIAAGKQGSEYAARVNEFDWDEFYEKWHGYGFIEFLKSEFKEKAEIVLLDSRTGVTDIGGICTLQLPDLVILLFALNEQNISGIEFIAENILKKAPEHSERDNPPTLIVRPARVERYLEQDKKNEWEERASKRLQKYLPPEGKNDPLKFIKRNNIPYIGAYSFGEALAVKERENDEPAVSFDALTISVLKECGFWEEQEPTLSAIDEQSKLISTINPRMLLILTTYLIVLSGFLLYSLVALWPKYEPLTNQWESITSFLGIPIKVNSDLRLILLTLAAGGLGSVIHALRSLFWYVGNKRFSKQWIWYYMIHPWRGMLMSFLFYLILRGTIIESPSKGGFNLWGIVAVSGLIGLFSDQVFNKLLSVTHSIFRSDEEGRDD
jgi:hypothetical protein